VRTSSKPPKPESAKYIPYPLFVLLRPIVRWWWRWHGAIHGRTIHACAHLVKRAALRFTVPRPHKTYNFAYRLIQIDEFGTKSPKIWVDLDRVSKRLDVTGLRRSGVPLASDTRDLHRGNLVIGQEWTPNFIHKAATLSRPAEPGDLRYETLETLRMLLVEGRSWDETPEFLSFKSQLERGLTPYAITNMNDLNNRGDQLIRTFRSLSTDGYLESQKVGSPYWDESHIYIYGDGELCFGRHANHRILMAKLLGIPRIPVLLGGIHVDWAVARVGGAGLNTLRIQALDYVENL